MKKIAAILLLFLFLSANTAFGQLFKLPVLIEHFSLHQDDSSKDEHDDSFLAFLKEHYCDLNSHSDASKHSHGNLPFKAIDSHPVHIVVLMPQHTLFLLKPILFVEKVSKVFCKQQFLSSASLGSIWQPPRFC